MTASRATSVTNSNAMVLLVRLLAKGVRAGWIVALSLLCLVAADLGLHFCGYCPIHFRRINDHNLIPVGYGYVIDGETIDRAARGEIRLGGCVVGLISRHCPYCGCPARLTK